MVFASILDSINGLTLLTAMACTGASLLFGFCISYVYRVSGSHTKHFSMSLVAFPVLVQSVIMMVNGNLGAGVAVMGAFGLVRFRSVPGSSRDICYIFFAMAIGLATGMGYLTFAAMITICVSLLFLALNKWDFGGGEHREKTLKITIPEDLDYAGIFNDIFQAYTESAQLERVKTTNLGSLFELEYKIRLKTIEKEKAMLDEIRCRNGNLTIVCANASGISQEL